MAISSKYYYQSELTESEYSTTQSNVLNVSRMLQHKPFWRQPYGSHLLKKKILIINDPAIANWDETARIVAAERFKALQDQGFIIYVQREGHFSELITTALLSSNQLVDSTQTTDKTISEQATKQLQLSHDEVFVLNHEEINELIHGFDEDWLKTNSTETINLKGSNINIASLDELLNSLGNNIELLNLSECINLRTGTLYKDYSLDKLEALYIEIAKIPYNKKYSRINNLSSSSIKHLLKQAPNIKLLALDSCKNLDDDLTPELNSTCLELLGLRGSNINSQSLNKILANAPKLKKLALSYCENIGDDFTIELNLACLEDFDSGDSNISSQCLNKILANAPKLKRLYLADCKSIGDDLTAKFNLASLEELYLSNSNISSKSLDKILANAPKLKKIHLDNCTNIGDDLTAELNLPCLEELEFSGSNISSQSLKNIVAKALNLKNKPTFTSPLVNAANSTELPSPLTPKRVPADNEQRLLDADTLFDPEKKFVLNRLFYASDTSKDPETSSYRLNTYNQIELNKNICTIKNAFTLNNTMADRSIIPLAVPYSISNLKAKLPTLPDASRCYYGIQSIHLSEQWLPLASLSAEEVMTEYRLSRSANVDIGYSQRDNRYCIRRKPGTPPNNEPITIEFIVKIPAPSKEDLPLDIKNKIQECLTFGSDGLKIKSNACGADYLEALNTQKMGACRHRSLVFKTWMDTRKPSLPTRIVDNQCHSFAEVYYNQRWIPCDLGGYPAQVTVVEQTKVLAAMQAQRVSNRAAKSFEEKINPAHSGKRYFAQKRADKNKPESTIEHMQQLLASPGHKKLIQRSNEHSLHGFRYHLQKYCHSTSTPCFYIHSPEDLICSAPYIDRKGSTGILKKGPSGPLHDFLQKHSKDGSKPVLIVNYDQFSARDIVRFNSLLDKERFADGSPIPPAAQVIGLMNPTKSQAYNGADFLSRFDAMHANMLPDAQLIIPPISTPSVSLTQESQPINLYAGKNWEDRLLGHWVLKGQQLHFIEGELLTALNNKKKHIELHNAPWHDPAFHAFWHNALLSGTFQVYGTEYTLPKGFKLSEAKGYSFEKTKQQLEINDNPVMPADVLVLNHSLLDRFFNQYRCTNQNESINYEEGILEKNSKKTINVYLNAPLDLSSWALFLDECQHHQVKVSLTLAPGVTLPRELGIPCSPKAAEPATPWPFKNWPATTYVQSTDMDVTLKQLPETALIIDVSEVSAADLIKKIDATFDEQHLKFHFKEQEGALLKALKDNKTVVLKGKIPEELRHILSELLLQRHLEAAPKGRLLLLSDQPHLFPMLPSWTHQVSPAEKMQQVAHQFPEALYKQHSLVTLQAMARHLVLYPADSGDNAWLGMKTTPLSPVKEIVLNNTAEEVKAFNQQRLNAVEQVLQQAPYVFLAGITGVGKTTFIHEVWKKKHAKVYPGEANKLAWAKDRTPGIKTLFIDEANISSRQWSEFEGLFLNPPSILINNEVIELTKDHKVIFSGNPLSYGGERQLPSFLARHGNSVLFNPLPPAYIYHEVLKPIFVQTQLPSDELALPILEVAQYCNALAEKQIRITPREQEMMALLTISYCIKYPAANATKVAQYYAYTLAERFIPEEQKPAFAAQFKKTDKLPFAPPQLTGEILINAKNQPAFDTLNDLLELRSLRQSKKIQAEGGLGGLIIEGEPGLGKTELVINALRAFGLRKGALHREHLNEPVFYVIPVSMSFEEKTAVLLKAFHEGAPVVMDEINSAPMMERLLNDLLMGKDPQGNKAKNPGFILLGTQNPATMAGRTNASTALEHRMQQVVINEYSPEEMMNILTDKGLPKQMSQEMLTEYLCLRQEAVRESAPPLCFRDLIRQAEFELVALGKLPIQLITFLTLLDELKEKQQEYLAHYPKANEQAKNLIEQLKNKAESFYRESNFSSKAVKPFKEACIKIIEENSSVLKEHRAFLGAVFAAIHQFFITLRAVVFNELTTQRFFDSRTSGAKVADQLALEIKNVSVLVVK